MSDHILTPDPDLEDGPGGGCSVSESWGDVQLIHECRAHPGEFKRTVCDGPIEWTATDHRFYAPDGRILALASLVTFAVPLPHAEEIEAARFVTLTPSGVVRARPADLNVIGCTLQATADGALVPIELHGIPVEVEAAAPIAAADQIEIDGDGRAIVWTDRPDAPPHRGIALRAADPGTLALVLRV